jgi:uncharacterized membrane protein YccC
VSLTAFFARELAPSHRRIVEAARTATKAMLTTGLAAIMQTLGPFGPLFAFRIGQPGISFGFFEGAVTIACAAAMQAAIVPITGKILDYPGIILALLFGVFAAVAYLLSNTRLFLPLALVVVATITTIYVGVFEPGQIGWGSTYTFDGIVIATLVMVALDTYIWPSPPEPRLLESIAADLTATRKRLALIGQRYLDPFAAPLPPALAQSRLAPNLALLDSVNEHAKPAPQRVAALLNAVVTAEHLYLEVERLSVLAEEPLWGQLRQQHGEQIELSLGIIDAAFAKQIERILAGLLDEDKTAQWVSDLSLTIQALAGLNRQASFTAERSTTAETLNFLGFVAGLEAVAALLEPREPRPDLLAEKRDEAEDTAETRHLVDPARVRFSVKLGASITLGLLVGLTTQRADLQTILWSIAVVGQPNQYGAVIRKTALRLAGCIIGGLAALATMIIISENFDSLPPYVIAIFAVTLFATYISQSSEWLGYMGIQIGITFLICYVGLAPSSDIYKPLWRFWGIVLGVLTAGFVFLFLWPEYASDKVITALEKLTRTTWAFAKAVAEKSITHGRIARTERQIGTELFEVLNMADQARLEGRRGSAISAAAVEAAALLIRIAYRFETIACARLGKSEMDLPPEMRQRCAHLEEEYCLSLESALEKLTPGISSEQPLSKIAQSRPIDSIPINETLLSLPSLHHTDWTTYAWLPQQEAYRRIPILLSRFNSAISKIAISKE